MPIKAKTEYTKDALLKFARFSAVRSPVQIDLYLFLELIMLGMGLFFIVTSENGTELFLSAALITPVFLLLVPLVIWFMPILTVKMSGNLLGCINTYTFFEKELDIQSDASFCSGESRVHYQHLDGVYETNDTFYLFISKQQAFIVKKSDITEGTVRDLHALLRRNVPPKKYHTRTSQEKRVCVLAGVVAGVMTAVIAFSAVYAYLNLNSQYQEKTFSQSGLTITLTDGYQEKDYVSFTAAFESEHMAVFALKEEFSLFGNERPSLEDYAGLILEMNQLDATVQEADGLTCFTYRTQANGKDYQFFSVVYMGSDAYWLVQFCCDAEKYQDLETEMIQFAKSVTVS